MISDQSRAEEMRRKLGKPYLLGPYRKHPAACMDKMCMCITVCEDQYGRSELVSTQRTESFNRLECKYDLACCGGAQCHCTHNARLFLKYRRSSFRSSPRKNKTTKPNPAPEEKG
jgi:hypothetical protein